MFLSDKVPYIVTILVGALAWSVTHVVDRLNNTPLLKYDMLIKQSGGSPSLIITLQNVTNNKVFKNLSIVASTSENGAIKSIGIRPTEPAFEGDSPYTISTNRRTAQITLPVIQPGWLFEVTIKYTGANRPRLRIDTSNDIVMLTMPGIKTFLVAYEFEVILGFIVLWLVFLAIIFIASRKKS